VRRGVGGLVKVDDTVALELSKRAACGGPSAWKRGEMVGLHVQLVKVLLSRLGQRSKDHPK